MNADPISREAAATLRVYRQLPFVPKGASGCDLLTEDGQHILDFGAGMPS